MQDLVPLLPKTECLNETLFSTLGQARHQIRVWHGDYNHHRPHSGLGNMTPVGFIATKRLEMRAASPQKSTCGFPKWPVESRVSAQYHKISSENMGFPDICGPRWTEIWSG
jgi:Integrase core domain